MEGVFCVLQIREVLLGASIRVAFTSLLLSPSACDDDGGGCTPGYETCACTAESVCLEGLQCLSSRCVDPKSMPEEDDGDDTEAGGGMPETDTGHDNESACEMLLDSLECAPPAGVALIDCASFGSSPCDLADYFECLADNTMCSGEQLDASGWTQCMDLAVCS
ncbi:MAG: hypothetical protein ACRBN8_15760 [Nannocystales bacterium]